jgi:DNA segregation ATPase FtsK/SpoIIIE, S-DNA-T family
MPRGEVALEAPPELPLASGRGLGAALAVLPLAAGVAGVVVLYTDGGLGPATVIVGALFGTSLVGAAATAWAARPTTSRDVDATRADYLRYLAVVRRRVRRAAEQQRRALLWSGPDPETLWSIARSRRQWERRPGDSDFASTRVAVGDQRLAVELMRPETRPVEELEPVSAVALRRFVRAHATVPRLPVALALRGFGRVSLRGEREPVLGLVRALLGQLVTFHAPEDLWIAVVCGPETRAEWEWVKWLPHALHPERSDGAGPVRLVFGSTSELEEAFAAELADRPRFTANPPMSEYGHVVVVLDGGLTEPASLLTGAGLEGTTVLDLSGEVPPVAGRWLLSLHVDAENLVVEQGDRSTRVGRPDRMPVELAEALARQLSPYRLAAERRWDIARALDLLNLLQVGDPAALDASRIWRSRPERDQLRIPIGVNLDGTAVMLDLKESAAEGMGPHGLVLGATGSGKSELLRTIVVALAVTHPPDAVSVLLVDVRGGATFGSLGRLPHTAGLVTGLRDEPVLIGRLQEAIIGELQRRQETLRGTGYVNHREYARARRGGAPLEPLPNLVLICDEFSELLTSAPNFIDVFIQLGRLGRSLGVHMLLATQRLEEGRLRGLDTHLSYRVGLRTMSAVESRIALGVPDAYELPRSPGHGYLKVDSSTMLRFRASYISGEYRPPAQAPVSGRVVEYGTAPVPLPVLVGEPEPARDGPHPTTLDVLVERLHDLAEPAHQVWSPPGITAAADG